MHANLSYIVCASQRSGSNYLCALLRRTNIAGNPHEFFLNWHMSSLDEHKATGASAAESFDTREKDLADMLVEGCTPNGVFGIKIMGNQIGVIKNKLCGLPRIGPKMLSEAFDSIFPKLMYIHLKRIDRISQAVSYARAIQSDLWLQYAPSFLESKPPGWSIDQYTQMVERINKSAQRPLQYNREQIAWCLRDIDQQEMIWEEFFQESGIEPLRLIYEKLEELPDANICKVLEYLGLPSENVAVSHDIKMQRQRDDLNTEWMSRFCDDMGIL